MEILPSRQTTVGAIEVRRALPQRRRRSVGPWCFIDHVGPALVSDNGGLDIAPHPHIGLQTVTWLLEGEALHRDSLGHEQVIRPGQLNLMTAGYGIAHSEESTGRYRGDLHGVQLWVAQPEATRGGEAAFEHHDEVPHVDLGAGAAAVLVGEFAGAVSPARRDTDHFGVELSLRAGITSMPLTPGHEHALVVFSGAASLGDQWVQPGNLAYLGTGRDHIDLAVSVPTRALLVGGEPLPAPPLMWWNFVARTREEISDAYLAWRESDDRFGTVASTLSRVTVAAPPWMRS